MKCTVCGNTNWTKGFSLDVWHCTNCSNTRPVITRKPKGFYITTVTSPATGVMYYLTSEGWVTFAEIRNNAGKMCYHRKTKNIQYWMDRPPVDVVPETTFTEY